MTGQIRKFTLLCVLAVMLAHSLVYASEPSYRIVFGSFSDLNNAENWSRHISAVLKLDTRVQHSEDTSPVLYRVVTIPLVGDALARASRRAKESGMPYWRLSLKTNALSTERVSEEPLAVHKEPSAVHNEPSAVHKEPSAVHKEPSAAGKEPTAVHKEPSAAGKEPSAMRKDSKPQLSIEEPSASIEEPSASDKRDEAVEPQSNWLADKADVELSEFEADSDRRVDIEIGLQSRSFFDSGARGQSRFDPSVSIKLEYRKSWDDGESAVLFTPFFRFDVEDSRRRHADIRELYWNRVGVDWELSLGLQQVFWGVTEFSHLVDIINQTDFIENVDDEDKLGQPMLNYSLVRNWGILDLMLLPGFRERTFPGNDGRLNFGLEVDTGEASYASGAGQYRLDAAVRWSHYLGPVAFGVYHFSGTNRDPQLIAYEKTPGSFAFRPHYTVIDQTGIDAQLIVGDWVYKVEAIRRSGDGEAYQASTFGFEKSLVGVAGTRADLGLVAEYMYDDRGDSAATLYEHDLALGTRWQLNDPSDTQALLGLIWDTQTQETVIILESSRRLGEHWKLMLEGRVFSGATKLPEGAGIEVLDILMDFQNKSASLQRDDYIQIEFSRYL